MVSVLVRVLLDIVPGFMTYSLWFQFEISPDEDPDKLFVDDNTPEKCHSKLVEYFKDSL